jgi:hypothetical protein
MPESIRNERASDRARALVPAVLLLAFVGVSLSNIWMPFDAGKDLFQTMLTVAVLGLPATSWWMLRKARHDGAAIAKARRKADYLTWCVAIAWIASSAIFLGLATPETVDRLRMMWLVATFMLAQMAVVRYLAPKPAAT